MKAVSLMQPWASLVVMGIKTIETRSWNTRHRGLLLIHASSSKAGDIFSSHPMFAKHIRDFRSLPFGKIIGRVFLRDVIRFRDTDSTDNDLPELTLEEKAFGDYTPGRYGWMLEDPVEFEKKIIVKGMPGIWNIPFVDADGNVIDSSASG